MGSILSRRFYTTQHFKYHNSSTGDYGGLFVPSESNDISHLNHHVIRELWQSNFSAPVANLLTNGGAKVLDVGCGTGTFLCEISTNYPKSEFIGIDILQSFPTIKPFNVSFMKKNIMDGLPFDDNTFDFVHIRALVYEFTMSQWMDVVYKELLRVLKPGGWLEISDPGGIPSNAGPATEFLFKSMSKNAISRNINPYIVDSHYSNLYTIISNNNINEQEEKIVIHHDKKSYQVGKWSGRIGETASIFVIESLKNYLINGKKMEVLKLYNKQFFNCNDKLKRLKSYEQLLQIVSDEFEFYKTYLHVHRFYYQKI